jgi:glycosyltransferase involved in cell wall biosynthesis
MTNSPVVEVLLATYNGELYLREQIDSILGQDYANLRVLARDDGSTDGTVAILGEYAVQFPSRFRVLPATTPTGHAKWNFLELLKASTADYVCFADQDDVWIPEKVTLSLRAMEGLAAHYRGSLPLLVFTNVRVVDRELKTQIESQWRHHKVNVKRMSTFPRLLGQNIVTGCTAMLNRPLAQLALSMPEEAILHDHWVALLAAAFGASRGLEQQTVLYRQHDNNVMGAGSPRGSTEFRWTNAVQQSEKRWRLNSAQAEGLLRVHGADTPERPLQQLRAFLQCRDRKKSKWARIALVLRHGFYVLGPRNNLAMLRYLWS